MGLLLFLGSHSVRICAEEWRHRQIEKFGKIAWRAGYSIVALAGLVLIILGFGMARQKPVVLWVPPPGMLHVTALFVLIAFVLIAATYVPRNHIKTRLHHPMTSGVQAWAFGHLLANGTLADIVLFGSFLIWAIFSFKTAHRRDRLNNVSLADGTLLGTTITIVAGSGLWVAFLLVLHKTLIGVPLLLA
ncbi:MAG TPA: NnrU family protein [Burkholderiaceae bacterium]|nr:NnrU family protein [Burkholderiaceae bacterium]